MVNALMAYYTNRRRNSAAATNASSDEIDGIHGEQDLDGESSLPLIHFEYLVHPRLVWSLP